MNRLGMVIDMSHSGERSTLEAIDLSARPITVSHANPSWWRETGRNKSRCGDPGAGRARRHARLLALSASPEGRLGLHARRIHRHGAGCRRPHRHRADRHRLGPVPGPAGCDRAMDADRPLDVSASDSADARATFPAQPAWFQDNRDFGKIRDGLARAGFADARDRRHHGRQLVPVHASVVRAEPATPPREDLMMRNARSPSVRRRSRRWPPRR